MYLSLLRSGV